jgi:hypothetical protein
MGFEERHADYDLQPTVVRAQREFAPFVNRPALEQPVPKRFPATTESFRLSDLIVT